MSNQHQLFCSKCLEKEFGKCNPGCEHHPINYLPEYTVEDIEKSVSVVRCELGIYE